MSDTISRQAAIDAVLGVVPYDEYWKEQIEKAVNALPSAQPQRMRGEWIDVTKTGGAELWKCSECGELELEDSYFCPNCGAKMDEEKV